jgi:DNA polymerase I-like protein with 3'-5' exonuclease and polymerase domains
MIADYYVMNHRRRYLHNVKKNGTIKGAISTVRDDGRVPAKAMTCATPTSRYRHMETVCNMPKPSKPYGTEIRSLIGVEPGHLQIGIDLSGIEARQMCHYALPYPGGQELADLVLDGDFHQHNADYWDCTRDDAKNGLYALMYGCGEAKLASQLNKPKGSGKHWFDIFWQSNPALKALIDDVNGVYDTGRDLMGIDRRRYSVRQKRMALNTLFQGGAAIVFKHWMRLCDDWIQEHNAKLPSCQVHQMIAYHDELQFELCSGDTTLAEEVASNLADLASEAGRILKIKVPIAAEYKIGTNWAECH